MQVSRSDFDWAVSQKFLSANQCDALWTALEDRIEDRPGFNFTHLVYYLGAVIVISAMTWFMTEAWDRYSDSGVLVTASAYGCLFMLTGRYLWKKPGFRIPGGLLYALAVCMTPLIMYGIERTTGFWPQSVPGFSGWVSPEVRLYRYPLEVATIAVGLITLRYVRCPFLTIPVMAFLWALTLDLVSYALGLPQLTELYIQWTAIGFGLALLLGAYLLDRRTDEDYSFWIYPSGLYAFWAGLTFMRFETEYGEFLYCVINLALMCCAILLGRRIFFGFGTLGVFVYLGHLASLFKDSLLFPLALSVLGMGIIFMGVQYQRHRRLVEQTVLRLLPAWLHRHLPRERMGG